MQALFIGQTYIDVTFLIDRLPHAPNIIIASACSGHGFKFAPLIGEILADLATTGAPDHDLAWWALAEGLRDPDDRVKATSQQALQHFTRECARKTDQ